MLPNVGDEVKLTDEYVKVDSTKNHLKDTKLDVLKVDLNAITTDGPEYSVWFSNHGLLDGIDVDSNGYSMRHKRVLVFQPWSGGFAPSKQKAVSEDDRCKKCGTMGEMKGLSCICPNCGQVVWGI